MFELWVQAVALKNVQKVILGSTPQSSIDYYSLKKRNPRRQEMKGQIVLLREISTRVNCLTAQSRLQMSSLGAPGAPGSQTAAEMRWVNLVSASKRAPPWDDRGHSYSGDVTRGSGGANSVIIWQLAQHSNELRDDLDLHGDASCRWVPDGSSHTGWPVGQMTPLRLKGEGKEPSTWTTGSVCQYSRCFTWTQRNGDPDSPTKVGAAQSRTH